jgi:sugar/nucleoside kinase (ribokinase family)
MRNEGRIMTEQICKINVDEIAAKMDSPGGRILLGIDGFIDEVWQIIKSRVSIEEYQLYDRMNDYAQEFVKCEEGGFSHEIISKRRSRGGFTANTGKAVCQLGMDLTLIGFFGLDRLESVFAEFNDLCKVRSVRDPGHGPIFEFPDGKVMLSHTADVMRFNWQALLNQIDEQELKGLFLEADVIGIGYWSLTPAFDEIVDNVYSLLKDDPKPRRLFLDLADIRKKSQASLESALEHLAGLNSQIPISLSLNENEGAILFSYHGETIKETAEGAAGQTEKIRAAIGLDELIVHTPYFASAASASEGACAVVQDHCESPVITTAAGDNFNAGYLSALLKGLPMAERLDFANAVTYLFVSQGQSPTRDAVIAKLAKDGEMTVYR